MSNITYVSAIYQIYPPNQCDNVRGITERIITLLQSPIHLILYADDYYYQQLVTHVTNRVNNRIILILKPLSELTTYQRLWECKDKLILPTHRHLIKDTFEYMLLMNAKVEFLSLAEPLIKTPYAGWIDAGIGKIFKNPTAEFDKLSNLNIHNLTKILIPGPQWNPHLTIRDLQDSVRWNFCGGYIILPIDKINVFYKMTEEVITQCIVERWFAWEVNLWVVMYRREPHHFHWYWGDHDESILNVPKEFIC